tara:strand:- start:2505 stop:2717 length:213 start_codon:yes stop_codon:yes gene_type:complete
MESEDRMMSAREVAKKLDVSVNYLYIQSREAVARKDKDSVFYPSMKGPGVGGKYKFSKNRIDSFMNNVSG